MGISFFAHEKGVDMDINLSEDMQKRIKFMALRTWDVIGGDVLTVMEEQGEGDVMSRAEVVECVCDADYMKTHGGDKEAYDAWNTIPFDKQTEIISEAFPHKRYGW